MGLYFGVWRVGLAVSRGQLAEPLSIVEVTNQNSAVEEIAKTCQREKIEEIVLGLPLDSDGQVGPAAQKVKEFGQKLAKRTGLEIIFWDETLTSEEALAKMVEAGRPRQKRRHLDDVVAALILQEYLDSQR